MSKKLRFFDSKSKYELEQELVEGGLGVASDTKELHYEGKPISIDVSNVRGLPLKEALAYGVEWDITISDPHLTRIGNMSMHKTLPIQSQLKGCVAHHDRIIYWLDENDWRWRKEPIYETVIAGEQRHEGEAIFFGILHEDLFKDNRFKDQYVRLNGRIYKVKSIHEDNVAELVIEGLPPETYPSGEVQIELGAVLNGYDGCVKVYTPNFYIKSEEEGNKRRVWLSIAKIDDTWTFQPELLVDAYRSCILRSVPLNMGYLSTLQKESVVSIANTADYCRGGTNNATYDVYLETDPNRTLLGKPITNISRTQMRKNCQKTGTALLNYDQYKNIFYWLWVVEYANFNSQEAFNEELTSEGYRQGGMGGGITNMKYYTEYNSSNPETPCGYGNDLGNGTGVKPLIIKEFEHTYPNITVAGYYKNLNNIEGHNTANYSTTVTRVINPNVEAMYHDQNNIFGNITYTVTGLTAGLEIIFTELRNNEDVEVARITLDGDHLVEFSARGLQGRRKIMFGKAQETCNIYIIASEKDSAVVTLSEQTLLMHRWRGFDNIFGDIWTNLDGVIIDSDSGNHPNNMNWVYTCQDPSKYSDIITEDYTKVGEAIHVDGYIREFALGTEAHIFPIKTTGANATTGMCDYNWTGSKDKNLRTLLFGGNFFNGSFAGLGRFGSYYGVSDAWTTFGFRSVSFRFFQ